jgi:peptide/nickel transport system permease protein
MLTYIIRRILILIPMAFVICFLVYLGLELTPGDAVSHMISPDMLGSMDPERLEALRQSLGLGQPFYVRFWSWFTNLIQGNFGYSTNGGVPIASILATRLPATLELAAIALLFSTIIGSILGVISALKRGTATDSALTVVGMLVSTSAGCRWAADPCLAI